MGNSRLYLLGLLCLACTIESYAQNKKKKDEVEINYIWIDTMIKQEGNDVRMVSNDMVEISCCMKSPKYSRVSARAVKWIRKNYDPSYELDQSPFKSLQNRDLVITVLDAAKEKAKSDTTILLIDYAVKCED